jgi:hypothetical protein
VGKIVPLVKDEMTSALVSTTYPQPRVRIADSKTLWNLLYTIIYILKIYNIVKEGFWRVSQMVILTRRPLWI